MFISIYNLFFFIKLLKFKQFFQIISTDMEIISEMKKDEETKAKQFFGHTEINKPEVSR